MRDGFDGAAYGKVVVGSGRFWRGPAGARAGGVVVAETQHDELRHCVLALLLVSYPALEMALENIHANLIRHHKVEVGSFWRIMAYQLRLSGRIGGDQRNGPGPLIRSAAPFLRYCFAGGDCFLRAIAAAQHGTFLRIGWKLFRSCVRTEDCGDVLAEVVVGSVMRGQIGPQVAAGR